MGEGGREEGRGGKRDEAWKERNEAGRRGKRRKAFASAVLLMARSTAVPEFRIIPLENRVDQQIFSWPWASSRLVTPFGMLEVNCDNSTNRAREEVWFGP